MLTKPVAEDILQSVRFPGYRWVLTQRSSELFLQVEFDAPEGVQRGRKWRLSAFMTKGELVQTAFKAVLTAAEHEVREKFTYRGRPIFGPHYNIDKLVEVCDAPDGIKGRD